MPGHVLEDLGVFERALLALAARGGVGSIRGKYQKPVGFPKIDPGWPASYAAGLMDPQLDATAQAELVRSGEVTPAGARRRRDRAHRDAQPRAERGDPPAVRRGARDRAGRRAVPRRAVPAQGPRSATRPATPARGHGASSATPAGRAPTTPSSRARFREAGFVFVGQDEHARARHPADHRAGGLRRRPQPVGHDSLDRAARAAARPRRWRRAWSRSPTRTTAAARSASRRACCGLVGLKPSRGRVSLAPEFGDVMSGLVAELVVSRSVRDTAAVLEWVVRPAARRAVRRARPRRALQRGGRAPTRAACASAC